MDISHLHMWHPFDWPSRPLMPLQQSGLALWNFSLQQASNKNVVGFCHYLPLDIWTLIQCSENMWKHVKTCENNEIKIILPAFSHLFPAIFWSFSHHGRWCWRPRLGGGRSIGADRWSKGKERRWFQERQKMMDLWWLIHDLWWFMMIDPWFMMIYDDWSMIYDDLWWLIYDDWSRISMNKKTNNVPFSREGFQGNPDFSALVAFDHSKKCSFESSVDRWS